MDNQGTRREFIKTSAAVLSAGAMLNGMRGNALGENNDDRLMRHRFGLELRAIKELVLLLERLEA